MERTAPGPLTRVPGATAAYARAYTSLRFRAGSAAAAERGRVKILAALDRLEAELGDATTWSAEASPSPT